MEFYVATQPPAQPSSNLLDLNDPEDWYCRIQYLSHKDQQMLIRVIDTTTKSEKFFLEVDYVFYLSGPIGWKGALLRQASEEECLQFMREMKPGFKGTNEELLAPNGYGKLFVFKGEECEVKIVAAAITKFDASHPRYRHYL